MALSNSPRNHTLITLEACKSFAFGMKFRDTRRNPLDLTGAEVRLVVAQPQHLGGAQVIARDATLLDAALGLAQFELQAEDLDLAEGEYPFAVVLETAIGYSSLVLKGSIDLRANVETESTASTYSGVNPSTNMAVFLEEGNVVNVVVEHVDGFSVIVEDRINDFTDAMDAKVETVDQLTDTATVAATAAAASASSAAASAALAEAIVLSDANAALQSAIENPGSPLGGSLRGAIADDIADSGTQIGTALTDTIAAGVETGAIRVPSSVSANIDLIERPFYIGHRGSSGLMPEETIEGFRQVLDMGVRGIEVDTWATTDGKGAVLHDQTLERTTDGTGDVTALTSEQFTALTVDASTWFANTAADTHPPLLDDVLVELGNRVILVPEIKHDAATQVMIDALVAHSISPRSVIVQATSLARCIAVVEAGYEAMWMGAIISDMPAIAANNDIRWIGCSQTDPLLNQQWVDDCHSAGVQVCVYSLSSMIQRDAMLALGVDAIMATDPIYVAGKAPRYKRDQFHRRGPVPGHRLNNGTFMEWFPGDYYGWSTIGGNRYTALHYLQPTDPTAFTLDLTLNMLDASSDNAWAGIWIGENDQPFVDGTNANYNGYHFFIRKNGAMNINYTAPGATTTVLGSLAAASATDLVIEQDTPMRITVTPTTVRVERRDHPTEFVQVSNTATRGRFISLSRSGVAAKWRDLVLT